MVFLASAFALELLAFVAGTALCVWSCRELGGKMLARVVGALVMAASLLAMACTLYYARLYLAAGQFEAKTLIQGMPGMGSGEKCPMMEMMEKMKREKAAESGPMGGMKTDE